MKSIEELALKEWSNLGYPVTADGIVKLCERFLSAYTEQQEPVGWMDRDGDFYHLPVIENWAPPHALLYAATVGTDGEVVVTTDEEGRCVAVTRQDEEGRILSVIWEAEQVPADMVLVPREPTEAMIRASWDCAGLTSPADGKRKYIAIAWHAMIAAWEKKS